MCVGCLPAGGGVWRAAAASAVGGVSAGGRVGGAGGCPWSRACGAGEEKTVADKKGGAAGRPPLFVVGVGGGVLLSHTLAGAVPSALAGLATGFGMGPGVSPPL